MPLALLPADPEPTEAEIQELIHGEPAFLLFNWERTTLAESGLSQDMVRRLARLGWSAARQRADPDAFQVPFSTAVRKFPDGAQDYAQYLETPRWKRIRERVLRAACHNCAGCRRRATEVHHRDSRPRVMRGEDDTPLVPLCGRCHHLVHHRRGGKPRDSWQEEEATLAEMVRHEDARLAEG